MTTNRSYRGSEKPAGSRAPRARKRDWDPIRGLDQEVPQKIDARFRARMRLWRRMASKVGTSDEDRNDIAFIQQEAIAIKPRRNEIEHNPFGASGAKITLILQKDRQISEAKNLAADEINRIAEWISLVTARCMSFESRHRQ